MTLSAIKLPNNWYTLHLSTTMSTMQRLRSNDLMQRHEEFVLLTTDYQTAGHGQRGTAWESDKGLNLTFSFLFHPITLRADQQFYLSEALSLAVAESLDKYTRDISVKWPNDIYWQDKKICGMLLEHDLQGLYICTTLTGVGVNVNQTSFQSDAPNPISLRQITGKIIDREELLYAILQHFEHFYRLVLRGEYTFIHSLYIKRLYRGTNFHLFSDSQGLFEAEIYEISPIGKLLLRRENGEIREYAFKEVAFEKE